MDVQFPLQFPLLLPQLGAGGLQSGDGAAALLGASLVLLSDLVGRTLLAPSEIPVGILMALIGAPFFLFLLLGRNRHA